MLGKQANQMKTIYRKYAIYSDANINDKEIFDVRVVLQKIGTMQITSHYPACSSLIKQDSETKGTYAGRKLVDILLRKNNHLK